MGTGAILADIVAHINEDFLRSHGFIKGERHQSKRPILNGLISKMQGHYEIAPGGSACNTIIGAANLGLETAFAAKCGNDQLGTLIQRHLEQQKIKTNITLDDQPTGICLSLVTPDSERTMLVDLAASNALTVDDIAMDFFQNVGIAHFEAYMASNQTLMLNLLERAYKAGCVISLDLGCCATIREHFAFLQNITLDYVDVLIGNYREGATFTGAVDSKTIVKTIAQNVSIAALKQGANGSLLYVDNDIITIEPVSYTNHPVQDCTGAGDLWNSGFLYGLAMGYNAEACGQLASLCGYEVCCVVGAQIQPPGWQRIQTYLQKNGLT